ncbi:hypothetical protein OBPA_25060 [Polaribacter sp. OB-PA-B3]
MLVLLISSCNQETKFNPKYTAKVWVNPEWGNLEIFQINREFPKATFYNYDNLNNVILDTNWKLSLNYELLNGAWNFYNSDSVQVRLEDFYKEDTLR